MAFFLPTSGLPGHRFAGAERLLAESVTLRAEAAAPWCASVEARLVRHGEQCIAQRNLDAGHRALQEASRMVYAATRGSLGTIEAVSPPLPDISPNS